MSLKEVVIDALATEPCRWLLTSLEKKKFGTAILNQACYPQGVFRSFEEAWQAAKRVTYAGHDHPDYIDLQRRLAGSLRASDYAVLYWLSRTASDPLRVLDYAGSIGNIYYSYADHLRRLSENLEWIVFDLPNAVEEGQRIAKERGERDIRFTSSLDGLTGTFTVLVSSAFHYWEKSVAEFVAQLPGQPVHMIVNRVPITKNAATFVTVQNRKTFAVPCMIRNWEEFVSEFADVGYRLVDSWSAPEAKLRMPLFPRHTVPAYSGFYFCKQSAKTTLDGRRTRREEKSEALTIPCAPALTSSVLLK